MKIFEKNRRESADRLLVIFSADRFDVSEDQNKINREVCIDHLNQLQIPFRTATGYYNNDKEVSYVCTPTANLVGALEYMAFDLYKQECLLVRNDGVSLVYRDRTEKIGSKIAQVSAAEAQQQVSYTELNGKFYVVR